MDTTLLTPLLLLALSMPSVVLAQTTSATKSAASSFPTMAPQDGFGVGEGGVGSVLNSTNAGSDGADTGAISITTAGIVGISVGIAVVVIALGT
jgi:hypothetical protein